MKKLLVVLVLALIFVLAFTTGVYATSQIQLVKVYKAQVTVSKFYTPVIYKDQECNTVLFSVNFGNVIPNCEITKVVYVRSVDLGNNRLNVEAVNLPDGAIFNWEKGDINYCDSIPIKLFYIDNSVNNKKFDIKISVIDSNYDIDPNIIIHNIGGDPASVGYHYDFDLKGWVPPTPNGIFVPFGKNPKWDKYIPSRN